MMILEVDGILFRNFLEISVTRSFSSIPGSFSFVATTSPDDLTTFPIEEDQQCRVLVDGLPCITGYVDNLQISYGSNQHTISVNGRSKVADLMDSTMDSRYQIEGPISLKSALKKVIKLSGCDIDVINQATGLPDFKKEDTFQGKIGSSIWSFMVDLAIKKQVLLTENGNGDVVITRGGGRRIAHTLINKPFSTENNILSSNSTRSKKGRFYKYQAVSQSNTSVLSILAKLTGEEAKKTVDIKNFVLDKDNRKCRVMCFVAESSSDENACKKRATWQANIARVRSFGYSCTVQGFTNPTDTLPWEPGQIPHIDDAYQSIDAELIIDTVTMNYSNTGGSTTSIKFVLPDAYTLQATEIKKQKSGNDVSLILDKLKVGSND